MNNRIVLLAAATIALLGIGVYVLFDGGHNPSIKEEAIRGAEQYDSGGNCTQAEVPAIHPETGAEYTFPTGCIAPGWVPKR
jgi:hypothetical protein